MSQEQQGHSPQQGPDVQVTVDSQPKAVHRGSYVVSDFKTKVDLDQSRVLDEIIDNQLTELKDDQRIVIKGGEVFISHVRVGGSS